MPGSSEVLGKYRSLSQRLNTRMVRKPASSTASAVNRACGAMTTLPIFRLWSALVPRRKTSSGPVPKGASSAITM